MTRTPSSKLLDLLRETGHWISGTNALPKRGGYHYELIRFTPEACIEWALRDLFAKEPHEHWYTDGRVLYSMIEDTGTSRTGKTEKQEIDYAELLASIKGLDEGYGRYLKTGSIYPQIDSPKLLDLEDETNRRRFRYARYKDQVDKLIEIQEELMKSGKSNEAESE